MHASVTDSPESTSVQATVDGPTTKVPVIVPTWVPTVDSPSNVMVSVVVATKVVPTVSTASTERGSFAAKNPPVIVVFWPNANAE